MYTDVVNSLIFFNITENCMTSSLRVFSSFMTVGPGVPDERAKLCIPQRYIV